MAKLTMKYFKECGRIGGLTGGKIAARRMTKEQLTARAKKAVAAREAKRKKNSENNS